MKIKFLSDHLMFYKVIFLVAFIVSLALAIGGFFVPPMGQIDGSVITVIGILMLGSTFTMIPALVASGRSAKIKHGDTTVIIGEIEDEEKGIICDDEK